MSSCRTTSPRRTIVAEHGRVTGGDEVNTARLLSERLRAGQLSEERLRLAAHLGDAASRLALEGKDALQRARAEELEEAYTGPWKPAWASYSPHPSDPELTLLAWSIAEWGREALVRASVGAGRLALRAWSSAFASDPLRYGELYAEDYLPRLLDSADAWIACPCEAHATLVRDRIDGTRQETFDPIDFPPDWWSTHAVEDCAKTVYFDTGVAREWERTPARERAGDCLVETLMSIRADQRTLNATDNERERVMVAIRAEVVPWALGLRDPVLERPRTGAK